MALGRDGRNDLATWSPGRPIDCTTFAPPDAGTVARRRIQRFLADEDGWLVLVFHGLDGEGWGTVSSDDLAHMLDDIERAGVAVAPPNRIPSGRNESTTIPRLGGTVMSHDSNSGSGTDGANTSG